MASTSGSGPAHKEAMNEEEVASMHAALKCELNTIYSHIVEAEMEVTEHTTVINAMQPLDPSAAPWSCIISGMPLRKNVGYVLPLIQRNREQHREIIASLKQELANKKKEIAEFEAKYNIRI